MEAQTFSHLHRVTYAECTVGNHVYYGRFLDLLEEARGEFFRRLGSTFLRLQEQDTLFPVVECHIRYQEPAHYDDLLTLQVWLTEIGRVRMCFAYRVANEAGQILLDAETIHGCTSTHNKLKRIPPELKQRLEPFLHQAAKLSAAQAS